MVGGWRGKACWDFPTADIKHDATQAGVRRVPSSMNCRWRQKFGRRDLIKKCLLNTAIKKDANYRYGR